MRCPACLADLQEPGAFCSRCKQRLFTWLGDPFGSLELNVADAAALSRPAQQPRQAQAGKLILWIAASLAIALFSPISAVVLVVAGLVLIWRRPAASWFAWGILIAAAVLIAVFSQAGSLSLPQFAAQQIPAAAVTESTTHA